MNIRTKKVFYDKLTYVYFEIPKFTKELHELESNYDRWLFAFKNLHKLDKMPKELEYGVFKKLFDLAEIAKMDAKERSVYEDSLKDYRDLKSAIDTSYKDGRLDEKEEIAKRMLKRKTKIEFIAEDTGLTIGQIEALRKKK